MNEDSVETEQSLSVAVEKGLRAGQEGAGVCWLAWQRMGGAMQPPERAAAPQTIALPESRVGAGT